MLKFHDFIKLQNCLFICQLEQDEQFAQFFPGDNHNFQTRSTTKKLLDIHLFNTYGTQSTNHNNWNSSLE